MSARSRRQRRTRKLGWRAPSPRWLRRVILLAVLVRQSFAEDPAAETVYSAQQPACVGLRLCRVSSACRLGGGPR
jgi:hypothetical protein